MLTDSFLDYLRYERNYSEKTVLAYGEDIAQLAEFVKGENGGFNPVEVNPGIIREWMISLMDKGYTSTSVNRKLSSLRSFYKFLLKRGEVNVDPLRKIAGPKNKKPLPSFLKESEMNKLLDETDFGEGFKGCRDRLIIEMFYNFPSIGNGISTGFPSSSVTCNKSFVSSIFISIPSFVSDRQAPKGGIFLSIPTLQSVLFIIALSRIYEP